MFPLQLVERVIRCWIPPSTASSPRVVLDPFCGSGQTLLQACRMGCYALGSEVSSEYVGLTRQRLRTEGYVREGRSEDGCEWDLFQGDARQLSQFCAAESVDLCFTSPPYWDVLSRRRGADGRPTRDYGESAGDISNIRDYPGFIGAVAEIFKQVYRALCPGAYCVVNVMDLRKGPKFYPYHTDLAGELQGMGFVWEDLVVWDRRSHYNRFRPLGYPAVFRVNKAHEFLLVLRRPTDVSGGADAPEGESLCSYGETGSGV